MIIYVSEIGRTKSYPSIPGFGVRTFHTGWREQHVPKGSRLPLGQGALLSQGRKIDIWAFSQTSTPSEFFFGRQYAIIDNIPMSGSICLAASISALGSSNTPSSLLLLRRILRTDFLLTLLSDPNHMPLYHSDVCSPTAFGCYWRYPSKSCQNHGNVLVSGGVSAS